MSELTINEVKILYLEKLDSLAKGEMYIHKGMDLGVDIYSNPNYMPLYMRKMKECEQVENILKQSGVDVEALLIKWEEESKIVNSIEYKDFKKGLPNKPSETRVEGV